MFSSALPGRSQRRLAAAPGSPPPPLASAAAAVVPGRRSVPSRNVSSPRRAPPRSRRPRSQREGGRRPCLASSPPGRPHQRSPRLCLRLRPRARSCAFGRGSRPGEGAVGCLWGTGGEVGPAVRGTARAGGEVSRGMNRVAGWGCRAGTLGEARQGWPWLWGDFDRPRGNLRYCL
ncbi:unnamed protein product [Urochloa humidicola]